jgi:hypothetical protein
MFIDALHATLKELIINKMPVGVWGPAGVGKSSVVMQIAQELTEELKEQTEDEDFVFHHVDIRLSQLEPSDLRGILYPDPKSGQAIWLSPSMLPTDPDWCGVIMLDELTSAPPLIQAAAYQLVLDRKIGDYELPEGASIVCAGNRTNDRGVVFQMAAPLANRMVHLELDVSLEKWKPWAYANNIDKSVIGFLSFREDLLHKFDPNTKSKAFPSPRTWEYTSLILDFNLVDDNKKEVIFGAVGEGAGSDFWAYRELLEGVVETATILNLDKDYDLPDDTSAVFGINTALVYHFQNLKKAPTEDMLIAVYRYLNKIQMDEQRVASFKEFTSNRVPIIGTKSDAVKKEFERFYDRVKHLIPLT